VLKKAVFIQRVGATKNGYWIVKSPKQQIFSKETGSNEVERENS